MKPLLFLCAIIGLNILWLPGLCELSSERGNLGVCPQLRSGPLAPAWLLLPGYLSEGSQSRNRTALAGMRPPLLFPRPSGPGEDGRESVPPHPLPRVAVGAQGGNARWCRWSGPPPSSRTPVRCAQADEVRTPDGRIWSPGVGRWELLECAVCGLIRDRPRSRLS